MENLTTTKPAEVVATPELATDQEVRVLQRQKLKPFEQITFSNEAPLGDEATVEEVIGLKDARLLAGIIMGGEEFFILASDHKYNVPYLLVDEYFMENADSLEHMKGRHYKGIRFGEKITVGRSHLQDRFDHKSTTSRDQFTLEGVESGVVMGNLEPTNDTVVSGNALVSAPKRRSIHDYQADFTTHFAVAAHESKIPGYLPGDTESNGDTFRGHPILDRNSRDLRNGVYVTRWSEALVVDHQDSTTRETVNNVMSLVKNLGEDAPVSEILQIVENQTAKILHYDLDATNKLSAPYSKNNGLVGLSKYIEAGVGVCRHQSVLAAHILEELIDSRVLPGEIGLERSRRTNVRTGERDAHAWAVYRPIYRRDSNDDIIIDPANRRVVSRKDSKKLGDWSYAIEGY